MRYVKIIFDIYRDLNRNNMVLIWFHDSLFFHEVSFDVDRSMWFSWWIKWIWFQPGSHDVGSKSLWRISHLWPFMHQLRTPLARTHCWIFCDNLETFSRTLLFSICGHGFARNFLFMLWFRYLNVLLCLPCFILFPVLSQQGQKACDHRNGRLSQCGPLG